MRSREKPATPAPPDPFDVPEIRIGRNFIRVGDRVRCKPLVGGGFNARVLRINVKREPAEIHVWGGRTNHEQLRVVTVDRVVRKAQTKNGEEVE